MKLSLFINNISNNRLLQLGLLTVVVCLFLNPWIFGGSKALLIAGKICVFILLVASYDLLIGYTGIISFAHTIFFAMGAYGVAMAVQSFGPSWYALSFGAIAALLASAIAAFLLGVVSFRVKRIFFAMITLAIASVFAIFINQNYGVTGGEDGLRIKLPAPLTPSYKLFDEKVFGVRISGKLVSFYLIFTCTFLMLLAMLRITKSPFGRILKAIRENEFRTNALGYTSNFYVISILVMSACFATVAGIMLAILNRYINTDTTVSIQVMIDILLMVVIGGMGTIYGAVFGVALVIVAQNYIPSLLGFATSATVDTPFAVMFEHERWLFWLGMIFILSVYFLPQGIAGRLKGKRISNMK
ncbi:MAG: branched-chain amino acid ABC transporter permease [Agarilytica sp.]